MRPVNVSQMLKMPHAKFAVATPMVSPDVREIVAIANQSIELFGTSRWLVWKSLNERGSSFCMLAPFWWMDQSVILYYFVRLVNAA